MKNIYLIIVLFFLASCAHESSTHQKAVRSYYDARNAGNFKGLKEVVSERITITAGDYVMRYDQTSFYEQFKWDSVFKPTYKILDIEEMNDQVLVRVGQQNRRNAFLKNNPLVSKYRISFKAGKISKLEDVESIDTDWKLWSTQRDSLVNYIKRKHPELDGFVTDMSEQGAVNYLKAIELYTAANNGK